MVSLLGDVCPCFIPQNESFHNIGEMHRKSRKLHAWEFDIEMGNQSNKILTVETMKTLATKKMLDREPGEQNDQKMFNLEKCPWNSESSDMLLKVERSVFPVHRFLLSIESEIFKTIIESIPTAKNGTTLVTLNGYDADEIQMLLTFVYLPESEIDGK